METQRTIKINNMKTPFKLKYTDGKKASVAKMFGVGMGNWSPAAKNPMDKEQDPIVRKIDEKVEEKVDEVVNQKTGEGLV